MTVPWPHLRIGIIGGGQLARLMTQKAKKLGFTVVILDPVRGSPAGQIADEEIIGGYHDEAALNWLCKSVDVVTYDLENVNVETLQNQARSGMEVHPSPDVLAILQDKLKQRDFLAKQNIEQPRYSAATPTLAEFDSFGFPLVQKLRTGGYDGRGVQVIADSGSAGEMLEGPSILEEKIDIEKELAVMVARSKTGEIRAYPVVEMEFDSNANVLDLLLAPARLSPDIAESARAIAVRAVDALGAAGIFGVELFLDTSGKILVNEIAPRPHNSGHYTFEACVTSQFEQHIRAVAGLPLGATTQLSPAVVVNLLGRGKDAGPLRIDGFSEALAIDGVCMHVYGKSEARPLRKMGHVTILDPDIDRARDKAIQVRKMLELGVQTEKQ